MASLIVDQLHKYGETRRGWLGVNVRSISDDLAESLGVAENSGALVESVAKDGPAAKAGILDGDIITRFDGKDITTSRALPKVVARTAHDRSVDVDIIRKGRKQTVKVVVGRLQEQDEKKPAAPSPKQSQGSSPKAPEAPAARQIVDQAMPGVKIAALDDASRRQFNIDAKVAKGMVVTEVDPQSPAALKGLKAGEVIVEVAQESIASLEDMSKAIDKVRKAGRKALLLRIEDPRGEMRFVAVQMP
jgi:serine protease Do